MATRTVDGKRLLVQQLPKKSTTSPAPAPESSSNVTSNTEQPVPSTDEPAKRYITHTEIAPTTRIVVVRTTSTAPNEKAQTNESSETERSRSVELPPIFTDGRTSVYLIRRPIPPNDQPKPTQMFNRLEDPKPTSTPTEDVESSPHSPSTRPKSSESSNLPSPTNSSPIPHSPVITNSENPKQAETSQRLSRGSKSRARSLARTDTGRQRTPFTFSRTKSTGVQVNLPPPETIENVSETGHHLHRTTTKMNPRKKSAKSIVLLNSEDNTIAVVENPYLKGETHKPAMKRPKSLKKTRFRNEVDSQSTEKLVKTSRWHTCLGCLSRHMCLIIIICFILVLIGLAGVGVSAYFLAINSQTNLAAKIVGVVISGVLAIAAASFLYCILGCIGSRDGYFSYNDKGSRAGGRAFALIPPSHPNAHLYIPHDYMNTHGNNRVPSSIKSVSTISNTQQQPITRQKTVVTEMNGTSNGKHFTIEMPERLLTGRKMSPKSHERNLNKVVKNIGHAVQDAKKRYNGDFPDKVIVKVDRNAKPTT